MVDPRTRINFLLRNALVSLRDCRNVSSVCDVTLFAQIPPNRPALTLSRQAGTKCILIRLAAGRAGSIQVPLRLVELILSLIAHVAPLFNGRADLARSKTRSRRRLDSTADKLRVASIVIDKRYLVMLVEQLVERLLFARIRRDRFLRRGLKLGLAPGRGASRTRQ